MQDQEPSEPRNRLHARACENVADTAPRPSRRNRTTPTPSQPRRTAPPGGTECRRAPRRLAARQGRNRECPRRAPGRHRQGRQICRRQVRPGHAAGQGQSRSRARHRERHPEPSNRGVELTLKQLVSAFQSANVSEINPLGEKFDPNKHQAISAIEADGEPNTVINVLQKGYLLTSA